MLALKLKKVCGYLMARVKIHFGTNKSNNSFESEKLKKSAIEIATHVLDISGKECRDVPEPAASAFERILTDEHRRCGSASATSLQGCWVIHI